MSTNDSPMRIPCIGLYTFLAFGAAACSSSPVTPSGSVTVTVAAPSSPANGAQIPNLQQPVTLIVSNALVTDAGAAVTYTFEVATDAAFSSKVSTRDVLQTPGQTLLKLDMLPGGRDYFWHVRASAGGTVGAFSGTVKFSIGPAVIISAPTSVSPANGASAYGWPTLTVTNAAITGPVGSVVYKFDIATSGAFSTITLSATVPPGTSQTSFTPSQPLPTQDTTFFWRATAIDSTNAISGPATTAQTFTVTLVPPNPLWPGILPTGTNGHARRGDNWQEQDLFSFHGIPFHSPTLDEKRVFDLLDRGFDPQSAIDWLNGHGYSTTAAHYSVSGVDVIGFEFMYMAFNFSNGAWDLVMRNE
jgi:hypothetical protein